MKTPKAFYRRNLPHIHPIGATFFVTYLLHGAIPKPLLRKLKGEHELTISELKQKGAETAIDKERKRYFLRIDKALHSSKSVPLLLNKKVIAQTVKDSLHVWDGKKLELVAYCIMPNHVHAVLTPFSEPSGKTAVYLQHLMESIKKFSAGKCNSLLGKKGQPFWQHESYDRVVRDRKELYNIISYTLDNPVKAGLCKERSGWEWSYINARFNEFI